MSKIIITIAVMTLAVLAKNLGCSHRVFMKRIASTVCIAAFMSLCMNEAAGDEKWTFSEKLQKNYGEAVLEGIRELQEGSSGLKKKAKVLCPDLQPFLKNSTQPIQDLVLTETALCDAALASKGVECTGGGLTGIGAGRALLRGELNDVCIWKQEKQNLASKDIRKNLKTEYIEAMAANNVILVEDNKREEMSLAQSKEERENYIQSQLKVISIGKQLYDLHINPATDDLILKDYALLKELLSKKNDWNEVVSRHGNEPSFDKMMASKSRNERTIANLSGGAHVKLWREIDLTCKTLINSKAWAILTYSSADENRISLYGLKKDTSPTNVYALSTMQTYGHSSAYFDNNLLTKVARLETHKPVYTRWRIEMVGELCVKILEEIRNPTPKEAEIFLRHRDQ